jgi:UDP-N-acetylmuramoylalanine--D-glutamate ligase
MDEAVALAVAAAQEGDAVLLSPACTSWDAYTDYAARGDDFARAVLAQPGATE